MFNTNSLLIEREQKVCKILIIAKQVTVSLFLKQIRAIKKESYFIFGFVQTFLF